MTGAVLAGKYRIESLIGRGGMGSVWRAQHLGLHAPVAVKLMNAEHFSGNSEALRRFQREAFAAAAIRSPHVVQILDHGFDDTFGVPFMVMELMSGETLAQRISRTGPIPPEQVAHILMDVARALTRAHESGIVHRDLKPDNVFLVRNEDEEIAKVLDFGIARTPDHEIGGVSTATGTVMGTPYYMSPEQISGSKNVDYRSDLWAYGVMACECLTGVRPFRADSIGGLALCICVGPTPVPSSLAPVPPGFDAWFARCVQHEPEQRFQSAREAAEALRVVCAPNSVSQPAPPIDPAYARTQASAGTQASGGTPPAHLVTVSPLSVSSAPRAGKRSKIGWAAASVAVVCVLGALATRFIHRPAPAVTPASEPAARFSADAARASSVHVVPERAVPSNAPPQPVLSNTPPMTSAPDVPSSAPPAMSSAPGPQGSAPPPPSAALPPGSAVVTRRAPPAPTSRPKILVPTVPRDVPKPPTAAPAPTRDVIDDRR